MNPRMTDYQTCSASSPELLEEAVREALKDGWQPLGGVSVVATVYVAEGRDGATPREREAWGQAMVKYAE